MAYDLAVVGAGIVGLAHALAAARRGKRVVVIERDALALGASIRNFGFVTVTGQAAGECWHMARDSARVWEEVCGQAGIPVLHRGLLVSARRPEAEAVIDAFLATGMGEQCRRLTLAQARELCPVLGPATRACLYSPHELRVESREALPRLAAWLAEVHGVDFQWSTHVLEVRTPTVRTSRGIVEAGAVAVCPGDGYGGLFADRLDAHALTRCTLQMLRVRPARRVGLGCAIMSDLGLARYQGYAALPQAQALKDRLDTEQAAHRAAGVHLIAVQSGDGTLVVGDSHVYGSPDPFGRAAVDHLIVQELEAVLDVPGHEVVERWLGVYASASDRWWLCEAPDDATRLVLVTSGTGASTGFAIGERTIADLFD